MGPNLWQLRETNEQSQRSLSKLCFSQNENEQVDKHKKFE